MSPKGNTQIPSLLILLLTLAPCFVAAVCECGYVVGKVGEDADSLVFTDAIESNFRLIKNIASDGEWRREQFNVTAEAGRGQYGKSFVPGNINIVHPTNGDASDAGLQLRVGSTLIHDAVPTAEIDSSRQDLFWGSYRAGMKLSDVNGTCSAFFWYYNDTQEIDMEFLSREFDKKNNHFPVNLVIQSSQSAAAGFNAAGTNTFKIVNLTFDPTDGFHEYRFDFVPGHVFFYADSELLADMNGSAIPTHPGHLILQHWSNGNPLWSGGPPAEDAFLTVSYVKAYFNTTDAKREADLTKGCDSAKNKANAMCHVDDVVAANASTGGQFLGGSSPQEGGGDGFGSIRPDQKWSIFVTVLLLLVSVRLL